MTKIILILFLILSTIEGFSQNKEFDNIPQGAFHYEIYFAEFGVRMDNRTCVVKITGNRIKVYQDESKNLAGGNVLFDGFVIKHKSGVWILADNENNKNTYEVGGCTEFPVIDFENKLIELC
ncbi:MAG: hypothetical protein GW771_12825 [Flavobacteriia bacterium]|nr:hypothetical protein [Flavobacteriia bacterium]